MSIQLQEKDLINAQQLEVAVNGPDGATHLILCAVVADFGSGKDETYIFLVGPRLSRRQFVGAIASGVLSGIQNQEKDSTLDGAILKREKNLISIDASYDDQSQQVKVRAQVSSNWSVAKLAISYNVRILAELAIR